MENTKKLLVTHIDLDGLSCYILAKYFDIELEDIWMYDYPDYENDNFLYSDLKYYDEVWYFDFTPNKKCRDIITEQGMVCVIGDHHEKVKEEIDLWDYNKKEYIFDNDKSGAKIFYEFLLSREVIYNIPIVKEYIDLVSIYDLYDQKSPQWKDAQGLNRLLYKTAFYMKDELPKKYEVFLNSIFNKFDIQETFEFNKIEKRKIEEDIKKELDLFKEFTSGKRKIKTRKDEKDRYFCIFELNTKISAICNLMLEKYKKLDYVIAINTYHKDDRKLSLRSREGGINLFEYKGVKGHRQAAGMENVTDELIDSLWSGKLHSLPLNNEYIDTALT